MASIPQRPRRQRLRRPGRHRQAWKPSAWSRRWPMPKMSATSSPPSASAASSSPAWTAPAAWAPLAAAVTQGAQPGPCHATGAAAATMRWKSLEPGALASADCWSCGALSARQRFLPPPPAVRRLSTANGPQPIPTISSKPAADRDVAGENLELARARAAGSAIVPEIMQGHRRDDGHAEQQHRAMAGVIAEQQRDAAHHDQHKRHHQHQRRHRHMLGGQLAATAVPAGRRCSSALAPIEPDKGAAPEEGRNGFRK